MGDQRKGRYSERWPQKPTYGVPASPWLRTGYIITITKPPDAYWIAIATKSRMELRYQRGQAVLAQTVLRDIGFLDLPRWRSP